VGTGGPIRTIGRHLKASATCDRQDVDFGMSLGAETVIERRQSVADQPERFDAMIDTVGGDAREAAAQALKRGGLTPFSRSD